MNPWTLLLWVLIIAICLVIAALAAGLVGAIVRSSMQWARQQRAGGDDREKGL